MPEDRFKRSSERERLWAQWGEQNDVVAHGKSDRRRNYRDYHLRQCREVLADPGLPDDNRRVVEGYLAWLEKSEGCLPLREGKRLLAIENAAYARRHGHPVFERAPRSLRINRSKEMLFGSRPAWMSDPSLLPKKPPGR